MTVSLRDFQAVAVADVRSALAGRDSENIQHRAGFSGPARRVLFVLPTGGGKCLSAGTPILMYDGSVKPVEDVRAGDQVMGPDSRPRLVESLSSGWEAMYRVVPVKGDPYVVNESHILSLRITGKDRVTAGDGEKYSPGDVCNISVTNYLKSSKTFKHVAKGWRTGIEFDNQANELPVPPYILGCWLGDGTLGHKKVELTSVDQEVILAWKEWAGEIGCTVSVSHQKHTTCNIYRLAGGKSRGRAGGSNPALNAFRAAGVHERRHIPMTYRTASRQDRLNLMAGILDADGYLHNGFFEIVNKSEVMARDIAFLARSLGFACSIRHVEKTCTNTGKRNWYWRLGISGHVDQIPCRIPRRQAAPRRQRKSVLLTGITVEPVGPGRYHGFELSGPDRLFLLGDFTVTHNTYTFAYITEGAASKGNRVLIIAHRKELVRQASLSLARLGVFHDVIAPRDKRSAVIRAHNAEMKRPYVRTGANVAVASVQTLARRLDWLQEFNPALLIPDEAHHAVAGTWRKIIEALPKARVLGVTATPTRTDGQGLGDVFETMVLGPSPRWMVDEGYLVPARVFRPPLGAEAEAALESVRRKGQDLDADAQAAIMDNAQITGNVIQHYSEISGGKPAIVFCANVLHARHVTERFCEAGWRFELVIGDMDEGDRDRALQGLADGRLHGVVSVDVISEGTDVPAAEVAILLRKTESESLYLQQVGRVLRPVFADGYDLSTTEGRLDAIEASDKPAGIVLDHVGNTLKHGLPTAERDWSLDASKRSAKKKKEEDEDDLSLEQCKECYHVWEPPPEDRCPSCGAALPVKAWKPPEESSDKLVEITEDDPDRQRRQEKRKEMARRAVKEKIALQKHVGDLLAEYVTNVGTEADAGVNQAEIRKMTPKPLRETRDRLKREIEEADSLRIELGTVCRKYVGSGGSDADIGFAAVDIETMKADRLRDEIDRVGGMMWEVKSA